MLPSGALIGVVPALRRIRTPRGSYVNHEEGVDRMKVLGTGASGFISSRLIDHLTRSHEIEAVAVDNRYRGRGIQIRMTNASRREPLAICGGRHVIDFVWVGNVAEAGLRGAPLLRLPDAGSGAGSAMQDLAQPILSETGSGSQVVTASVRSVEVERFAVDFTRFASLSHHGPAEPPAIHARWSAASVRTNAAEFPSRSVQ